MEEANTDTVFWVVQLAEHLWNSEYKIGPFASLIQVAIAANIAYAALVRAGQYQGKSLKRQAKEMQDKASKVLILLQAEQEQAYADLTLDDDQLRSSSIVSKAEKQIYRVVYVFVPLSLIAAIVSGILLFWCGAEPEAQVGAVYAVIASFILFFPVPAGLCATYFNARKCENEIKKIYSGFLHAVDHIRKQPQKAGKAALQEFREKVGLKPPGILRRLFLRGDDKDDEAN